MICSKRLRAAVLVLAVAFSSVVVAQQEAENDFAAILSNLEVHGFYEIRSGYRLRKDKYEKDMSIMEQRLQFALSSYIDWADFKAKGDIIGDMVTEQAEFDLREAYMFTMPLDFMDLKIGRQILTWGTGDLVFINDMFPKDWQSFFIGRDTEYLKAPSDAVKLSMFSKWANLDIVYTPQFDSDRFINGERISYWNSNLGRLAGQDAIQHTDKPSRWFRDDEIAVRLYKNINSYELALYGYRGYWKSPGGQNAAATQAIFPDLNVYGASVRGDVGKGIGNMEFGYYESDDDRSGKNGNINNSELRFLAGYVQEIGKDFTAGLQYYVEMMMDFTAYENSLPTDGKRIRKYRDFATLSLSRFLQHQTWKLSLFAFYGPVEQDYLIQPRVAYRFSDNFSTVLGANFFGGRTRTSFFGQFDRNDNIYLTLRYDF